MEGRRATAGEMRPDRNAVRARADRGPPSGTCKGHSTLLPATRWDCDNHLIPRENPGSKRVLAWPFLLAPARGHPTQTANEDTLKGAGKACKGLPSLRVQVPVREHGTESIGG